ncbi:hypothetical protein N7G274_009839 [Stereocaulon virgatum]|uniref:Uncharacterized protein n=1 Tax=Stereocaulon virgatum TaxID=373712 RepID=A0ABR3ZXU8_9LECA
MIRLQWLRAARFQHALFSRTATCDLRTQPPSIGLYLKCNFTSSTRSLVQNQKKPTLKTPTKAPAKPIQPTSYAPRKSAAYQSLNDELATRSSPTLLYRSSSYAHYITACWTAGALIIGIAVYNYRSQYYIVSPEDLPAFVPVFITVGSLMIACVGFWMLLKPQNMVQRISSLPTPSSAKSNILLLRIERTPLIPYGKPRVTTVPHTDVTVSSRLFDNDSERRLQAALADLKHRQEQLAAFAKTHLMTLPFRQAGYWIWRGCVGLKRAYTSEGFLYLHLKGNNRVWKMDRDPAWALDDGKALDRLVKVKIG